MPPAGRTSRSSATSSRRSSTAACYGYAASGYWLDIGTPERYLQATYDILEGNVTTEIGRRLDERADARRRRTVEGQIVAPALVGAGSIADAAVVGARTVLGEG